MMTSIPCVVMRGGTSRGPVLLRSDLPEDDKTLSNVLLAMMGSPDDRQIDGLGGATTLTSKVAIVSPVPDGRHQIDYLFAQVAIDRPVVDFGPTCGNMLAAVGPYAIEAGLVPAEDGETKLLIRAVNIGALVEAVVRTPGRCVEYDGDVHIDGVPGTAAPVLLNFMNVTGSKTGALLPTGNVRDFIEGIQVSCVDAAMPMVIARAEDLGKTGYESKDELETDKQFMTRIEGVRRSAAARMGMGDVAGRVIPKFAIIAPPRNGGSIASRYFTPESCHSTYAMTGGICLATCVSMVGSVADGLSQVKYTANERIRIEHPRGTIEVVLRVNGHDEVMTVERAGVIRTARRLMSGQVHIPSRIWAPGAEVRPALGL